MIREGGIVARARGGSKVSRIYLILKLINPKDSQGKLFFEPVPLPADDDTAGKTALRKQHTPRCKQAYIKYCRNNYPVGECPPEDELWDLEHRLDEMLGR